MTGPRTEGLSVVIICRNEADYIEGCLDALGAATASREAVVEILLIDGRSEDSTVAVARRWAEESPAGQLLRVVVADSFGYGYQRNLGIRHAHYPWIAFLSADVHVPPGWLREVATALDDRCDLAIGRFDIATPPGRSGWMASLRRTIYPNQCSEPWVEMCSTAHLIAPRARLLEHPFDESLNACEDKDLAYRLHASPSWRGGTVLSTRPRHLAREPIPRFLGKLYQESRALVIIRHHHGPAFPDCFGWNDHSKQAIATLSLSMAIGATVGCWLGPGSAAAAVSIAGIYAGWHGAGWRWRERFPAAHLAALHILAMWAVTAGWLAGHWRCATSGSRPPAAAPGAAQPATAETQRSAHA